MRFRLHPSLLLVLSVAGCSSKQAAIGVTVEVPAGAKATCVKLVLRSAEGGEHFTEPMTRDGEGEEKLPVAVFQGPTLGSGVYIRAIGYIGEPGCVGDLRPNEESAETELVAFVRGKVVRITVPLDHVPFDADADGYRASAQGGVDCDDSSPNVAPGQPELCADGVDNDCSDLADCADSACANQPCAGGICQAGVCQPQTGETSCNNGVDDDGDGLTDCQDTVRCPNDTPCKDDCKVNPTCVAGSCTGPAKGCTSPPPCRSSPGTCTAGTCSYPVAAGASCGVGGTCRQDGTCLLPNEICDNGIDDNDNGLTDCADTSGCPNNTPCKDDCKVSPTCGSGVCAGPAIACNTPPPCHKGPGTCSTGTCSYLPDPGASCDSAGHPGRCTKAASCTPMFETAPSNFTPETVAANAGWDLRAVTCASGSYVLNSSATSSTLSVCGQTVPLQSITQTDGTSSWVVKVVAVRSLHLETGATLAITGAQPVIFAVYGDATIAAGAHLAADANGSASGAGGNLSCAVGRGENGAWSASFTNGTGGGAGGGAYGTGGGRGGAGANSASPGESGAAHGDPTLVPLRGGCPGGIGAPAGDGDVPGSPGGGGGGAIQISAAGTLRIDGRLTAGGGGGIGGAKQSFSCANSTCPVYSTGAGGGGSGGGLLLEGKRITLSASARVTSHGGGGGEGHNGWDLANQSLAELSGQNGQDAADAPANAPAVGGSSPTQNPRGGDGGSGAGHNGSSEVAASDGQSASSSGGGFISGGGGGGGGGGLGRIRFNAPGGCTKSTSAVISPRPTTGACQ